MSDEEFEDLDLSEARRLMAEAREKEEKLVNAC